MVWTNQFGEGEVGGGIVVVCRILANRQSSVRPIKGDEDSLHNSVEEGAEA